MYKHNKKLSIVYIDFDDIQNPLLNAGQARATFEVASRLVSRGYQVTSLCSKYPDYKDRLDQGIFYKHIGLGTKSLRLNNLIFFLAIPLALRNLNADLIIECFTAPFSTLLSPLFTNIPVIALPSMFNAKAFSKKYLLPFHFVESLGMRFYKYMLPYSKIDSEKARNLNKNIDLRIIPQGVNKFYFKTKSKDPKHILFLGRFDIEQKGINLLLEAYSLIKNEIPFPLVLAGHGPDEKRIKGLIKRLKLEDKVRIAGSAYGEKKQKLISNSIFVAFPSRHDEQSLWVLEALACGQPLVCFDLPESKWISKKASLKAKTFDIVQYSKLLLQATDEALNKKMRVEARKLAKNFDWETVVDQFEDYFSYVLSKEERKNKTFNIAYE